MSYKLWGVERSFDFEKQNYETLGKAFISRVEKNSEKYYVVSSGGLINKMNSVYKLHNLPCSFTCASV